MPQSRKHAYKNSLGNYFYRVCVETGSEHLAEFYEIRIMLSDCEEALKAKLEEAGAKVTLK